VILLAVVLQIVTAQSAAPPVQETVEDIVVLGERLKQVQVRMKVDGKGRLRACQVTRSVGDAALDRFWCDAGVSCAATKPKDAAALTACVEGRKDEFLERLAAARSANRQN
jgi:hypothetical protein